jgi:hypothetical protein
VCFFFFSGVWHPFTNRDPSLAATKFPAPELYRLKKTEKSATQLVLEQAGGKEVGKVDSTTSKQ